MEKLNYNNAIDIFRNNESLRNRVWSDALENATYCADEILSYFRHYNEVIQRHYETLEYYEIDYNNAIVKPNFNNLKGFLEDCMTVADVFGIMDDLKNVTKKLQRAAAKIDLFEDVNGGYSTMSEHRYINLEKFIIETAREAADYIAEYAQEFYTQFDDETILEDYFLTFWLEFNDNITIDENGNVYETITKRI